MSTASWRSAWLGALLALAAWVGGPGAVRADDWPQWLGPQRDGVWREKGILDKFPAGGPKVLWRVPIGKGYTGPAVVGDRVYVLDRVPAPPKPKECADDEPKLPTTEGVERVLCLSAADGKVLWKHEYDCPYQIAYTSGPRTTPLVRDGKVYTLGAMGDLLCLDAAKGEVVWSKSFVKDYKARPPVWGWSASLLLDGNRLISLVGGEGSAVVAFDKDNGQELWRALTAKEVCYSPPMIYEAGGKRQLIIWLDTTVNGLDPEKGSPHWSHPYPADGKPQRPAVHIVTPRREGDLLLVSSFYSGSLMLKLAADKPAVTELWRGKSSSIEKSDGLHALMATPVIQDGHVYGVCGLGELRCLKADSGERVWESYQATVGEQAPFANAFLIPHGDHFFLFNDQGDLIIAKLSPKGYEEIDRAHLLDPTLTTRGRTVVWCHPAFANRCVFVRNDKEFVCVSLAAG